MKLEKFSADTRGFANHDGYKQVILLVLQIFITQKE